MIHGHDGHDCGCLHDRDQKYSSPAFYIPISGYKICIRLYLNGDGSARGPPISTFLVILRGSFDSLLKWPFSCRVFFCLCDQRTITEKNRTVQFKHIIEFFRHYVNNVSSQRTSSAMNIESDIPKLFFLNEFNQRKNENLYIVNDTIYVSLDLTCNKMDEYSKIFSYYTKKTSKSTNYLFFQFNLSNYINRQKINLKIVEIYHIFDECDD